MGFLTPQRLLTGAAYFFTAYIVLRIATIIRLLYFHPLRSFPGPRLAVITRWYRGYFDVILQGEWLRHLQYLHTVYGEVVRIGPNEVHFSMPQAYAEIYASGSPFTKEPVLYKCFGMDEGSFAIVDPHKSKKRREMLLPLFSRRAILKLENIVQEKVHTLITRIVAHGRKPVDMSLAFRCTTFDTISDYCFAQSFNALGAEGFQHPLLINMQTSIKYFWLLRYFPFILPLAYSMPQWLAERSNPLYKEFNVVRLQVEAQVDKFLASEAELENADHETVYHHLIRPKSEKNHETPSRASLFDEALVLLQAGSDTVGHTCIIGTFHALRDNHIHMKLSNELQEAWPNKEARISLSTLERLPYLTAFIKESLRVSHGVITPLARVVPKDTTIAGYPVPAGTIVSTGSTFMHNEPGVFLDPLKFNPERWLAEDTRDLDNHFVPFSRGPRMCIGFNLAWCELYLIFANIFRKLDMEIFETTEKDFDYKEIFVPIRQGRHLRALVAEKAL
ncbi:cytochrome P450 [Collybia nuda]|uniref:Cytochrome P450 n=1 Tax=Collybia nuda TaxID=64659 RepID=A0A9P6CA06_9AGAR|nr:cytochrome P450 [Collybia nuda]